MDDVEDGVTGGGSQRNLYVTALTLTFSYEDVILALRCLKYLRVQHRPARPEPLRCPHPFPGNPATPFHGAQSLRSQLQTPPATSQAEGLDDAILHMLDMPMQYLADGEAEAGASWEGSGHNINEGAFPSTGGGAGPQHTFAVSTEGVTLLLIDDFQGRFTPLLRWEFKRVAMQSTLSASGRTATGDVVLSMDSFDPTRGRWETALEPVRAGGSCFDCRP